MNKVELLVTMAAKPVVQGETPLHITFPASVAHKTKSGEMRNEIYPVSAWHGTAQWILNNLSVGQRAIICGYLAQKNDHSVEVCARQVYPVCQAATGTVINPATSRPGQSNNIICTAEDNPAVERINANGTISSAVYTSQEVADACEPANALEASSVSDSTEVVQIAAKEAPAFDTVESEG